MAYTDAVIQLLLNGEGWDVPRRYTPEQHRAIAGFLDLIRARKGECYDEDLEAVWRCWTEPDEDTEIEESEQGGGGNRLKPVPHL
ncbi:MAG: hypothetical protein QM680_07410 [Luteolibacter sp.]